MVHLTVVGNCWILRPLILRHTICSFPPLSSTRFCCENIHPKTADGIGAGSGDPVAIWKVQVAHHSNLIQGFCMRNHPARSLKQCKRVVEASHPCRATGCTPTRSLKGASFWNFGITFHLFDLAKRWCFLYFSEPRNRFHQWMCPNRILWWLLKHARFRPQFWKIVENEWTGYWNILKLFFFLCGMRRLTRDSAYIGDCWVHQISFCPPQNHYRRPSFHKNCCKWP